MSSQDLILAYARQYSGVDLKESACDTGTCRADSDALSRSFESVACAGIGTNFSTIRNCTGVDKTVCDIIPGMVADNAYFVSQSDTDLTVQCVFNKNKFVGHTNSKELIVDYYRTFGTNEYQSENIEAFRSVMFEECMKPVDKQFGSCRSNYERTGPMKTCSHVFENSEFGNVCYNWYNSVADAQMESAVSRYCALNTSEDCQCHEREMDDDFRLFKSSMPGVNPACYWLACDPQSNQLKATSYERDPTCPSTVCSQVTYISASNNILYSSVNQKISCNESFSPADVGNTEKFGWIMTLLLFAFIIIVIIAIITG